MIKHPFEQSSSNRGRDASVFRKLKIMSNGSFVGRTYSLYGEGNNSDAYYHQLRIASDECLTHAGSIEDLISFVRKLSKNKWSLKRIASATANATIESYLVRQLCMELSPFTVSAADHLRELRFSERFDRTLSTSVEQLHLYMLEIEL
ncbi:MAG TPA: hypothetical protein VL126_03345, partial [Bacteroidota bacterium]|nr:hypothetical protein [Bacteroidota bacterium]